MSHTYYAVYEHIAFSTKNRVQVLNEEIQPELFSFLAGAIKKRKCKCLIAGGYLDHVHLLVLKDKNVLTGDLVKEIKRTSSAWLKTKERGLRNFEWQAGYGAFSVGCSMLAKAVQYIKRQKEHHKKMTWEEEFRQILEKHGVEYDERYFLG